MTRSRLILACSFLMALLLTGLSCAPQKENASPPAKTTAVETPTPPAGELLSVSPAGTVQATLENGMTVLLRENHTAPIVRLVVQVKAGSLYEGKYLGAGISHLTEHLVHGGATPNKTEEQRQKILERIGNNSNAFTSYDRTVYFIETSADNFDTALELLSDQMMNCTIPPASFEREHGVVQRELERGEDEPESVLGDISNATAFQVSPIRIPVIGYLAPLKALTREDVLDYYHRRYVPNLMTFSAAGDFKWEEALAKARKAFGGHPAGFVPDDVLPEEPPQLTPRSAEAKRDVQLTRMSLVWHTVPLSSPDLYPLDTLSTILSAGDSSRLVRTLRDEKRLVFGVSTSSYTPGFGSGEFAVDAMLDEASFDKAKAAIFEEIRKVREAPVSVEELAKAKQQTKASYIFEHQTVGAQAQSMAANMQEAFDPDFDDAYVANMQKVTAEQILAVAKKYLGEDNYTLAAVRPKTATPPVVATEKAQLGPVHKYVLSNGMRLLVRRNPASPTVSLRAYFLAGVGAETEKNNGITNFMASLLTRGTKTRTAQQIAETFDGMGGEIGSTGGNNTFYVAADMLSGDFAKGLEVFADVIMSPSFPKDEVEGQRRLILAAIRQSKDNPGAVAEDLMRETLYTKSAYRLDAQGTQETVTKLTPEDLAKFHASYALPNNMVMAVIGDVEPEHVREAIEKAFAGFKPNPKYTPPHPADELPVMENRYASKQMERENAHVNLAYLGMKIPDVSDRVSGLVLQGIMTGVGYPTGWIFDDLRGHKLVYASHGMNWVGLERGYIEFAATCQPENVGEVLAVTRKYIEKAKEGKISDEEFERSRQMVLATTRLELQTNDEMASDAAVNEMYGLGYDFSDKEPELIRKVTKADLVAFANKYFTQWALVVVSPTAEKAPEKIGKAEAGAATGK